MRPYKRGQGGLVTRQDHCTTESMGCGVDWETYVRLGGAARMQHLLHCWGGPPPQSFTDSTQHHLLTVLVRVRASSFQPLDRAACIALLWHCVWGVCITKCACLRSVLSGTRHSGTFCCPVLHQPCMGTLCHARGQGLCSHPSLFWWVSAYIPQQMFLVQVAFDTTFVMGLRENPPLGRRMIHEA